MKIFNQTSDTCESEHILEIYKNLDKVFNNEWGLYVRRHEQPVFNIVTKYAIVIILSAEGHSYIPPETSYPEVAAVFMNYLPKVSKQLNVIFSPSHFIQHPRLFELQLGSTSWFTGTAEKPIKERKYDVSFIGQYDPYTRQDFFQFANSHKDKPNYFIHFYEGWNKGLGPEVYSDIMSDTKIALVPWGSASLDTFRFYEAMQSGCVVVCIYQNNYEFMENSPHVCVPNWSHASKYIDKLLNYPGLDELSVKHRKFWEESLSPEASARFIVKKILGE